MVTKIGGVGRQGTQELVTGSADKKLDCKCALMKCITYTLNKGSAQNI